MNIFIFCFSKRAGERLWKWKIASQGVLVYCSRLLTACKQKQENAISVVLSSMKRRKVEQAGEGTRVLAEYRLDIDLKKLLWGNLSGFREKAESDSSAKDVVEAYLEWGNQQGSWIYKGAVKIINEIDCSGKIILHLMISWKYLNRILQAWKLMTWRN